MLALVAILLQIHRIQAELGFDVHHQKFPAQQNPTGQPESVVINFLNGVPTVPFTVGSPPQKFVGILDTSSVISYVTSDNCSISTDGNQFHRSLSSTNRPYSVVYDLQYDDGEQVKVRPELDALSFQNGKIQFTDHIIGEAIEVHHQPKHTPIANARIGLGDFDGFVRSVEQGDPLFVIKDDEVEGNSPSKNNAAGDDRISTGYSSSGSPGFLQKRWRTPKMDFRWVFGVDDTMYTGPLYMLPLVTPKENVRQTSLSTRASPYWKVSISGLSLRYEAYAMPRWNLWPKQQEYSFSQGAYAQVHSSSPFLTVPPAMAKEINENLLQGTYDPDSGLYTVHCDLRHAGPSLVLHLAGVDATVPAGEYINAFASRPGCFSTIVSGPDATNAYLGGPFFRSFYIVYDYDNQKVGLAQSVAHLGQICPNNHSPTLLA